MPSWMKMRYLQWVYQPVLQSVAKSSQAGLVRYSLAVLSVLGALSLTLLIDPWVDMGGSPFLMFFAAIMISAWWGGLGPGVCAIVLSILAVHWVILPTVAAVSLPPLQAGVRLGLFVLVSLVISGLSAVRRELLKALRQERDLNSAIISTAGSLIVVLDRQGRIIQFNRTCERITGYSFADVQGKCVWDGLLPAEEVGPVREVFRKLCIGILPSEHEGDWLTREGNRRRIAWANAVLFDERGQVKYVIGTGIDITERDRTEKALQQTNQTLQALIQASPLSITVLDRQGIVKLWNPAAERIFGWTAQEAIGQVMPSVPPEKQAEFVQNIANTFEGKFENGMEVCRQRKDGSSVYLSLWAAVIRGADGDQNLLSVVADITDRKQAEAALKLSQERLTRFVDSNIIGIVFASMAGGISEANDEFLRLVGYSRQDLQTGHLSWRAITPPEYLPIDEQAIAEARERGACTPYEKEYQRQDGSRIPVLVGFTFLGDSKEQAIAFILDLTERKRLEQTLRCQTEELAQANRMKDEFLAVLSHELRTPLNAILGWAQLLRSRRFDSVTLSRGLETIERNARSQTQLIEDILDVAKVIQGKLRLTPRLISLVPVIEAAIDAMRPAANAKSVLLNVALDASVSSIYGDPDRLQQVVWNLLSNAIKFTPEGGQVTIRLSHSTAPAHPHLAGMPASWVAPASTSLAQLPAAVQITVSDTGRGISPEFLPFVFDRFTQADSSTTRPEGGLGLGLAIVRHLVELHGGTVQATSPGPGQGAAFTVRLPLMHTPDLQQRPVPAQMQSRLLSSSSADLPKRLSPEVATCASRSQSGALILAGLQVLVVDDELDTCEVVRVILEQAGATVQVATSSGEAWQQMTGTASNSAAAGSADDGLPGEQFSHRLLPDVLISDIGMPHEDGYMLVRKIRALPEDLRSLPAIALTAYAREEDRSQALAAGFQEHLAKPIDPTILVNAIARLVGRAVEV